MALIRKASEEEASEVASVFRRSREFHLPYLPRLHTAEEDAAYFTDVVFSECDVWVAVQEHEIIGFCAFKKDWLEHLYLLPQATGSGTGASLLQQAKLRFDFLQLWVFQRNHRAIAFYERHGFTEVKETDGSACEEKTPDVLYEWRRSDV